MTRSCESSRLYPETSQSSVFARICPRPISGTMTLALGLPLALPLHEVDQRLELRIFDRFVQAHGTAAAAILNGNGVAAHVGRALWYRSRCRRQLKEMCRIDQILELVGLLL